LLQVCSFKSSSLLEEVFMAIGTIANGCEADFERYLPHLRQYLLAGLVNWKEYQVCSAAVGVVGDVARAVGEKMVPYCNEIISIFLDHLNNGEVNRNVKPMILSTFGDIALAIGGHFDPYLSHVMDILFKACAWPISDPEDRDEVDFTNSLREAILEAFTGILQAMRTEGRGQRIEPYMDRIFQFIQAIWKERQFSPSVFKFALGTLGDLTHCVQDRARSWVTQEWVSQMINQAQKSKSDKVTKENAKYLKQLLDALRK